MRKLAKKEWSEKRGQVLVLCQEGCSWREIAKKLGIGRSTVSDALRRHAATGKNCDRERSGRPKVTSKREDDYIVTKSKRNRTLTAREIALKLNQTRKYPISVTILKRRLIKKN